MVYVNDIIVIGSSPSLAKFISDLKYAFALKDLGALNYFLGIQATTNVVGLHLSQSKYVADLLTKISTQDSTSCATPIASRSPLTKNDGVPFSDVSLYRSIVGALQHVTLKRPEIAFSVNKLSQFLSAPTDAHWQACKRVLHYLKGTINIGL